MNKVRVLMIGPGEGITGGISTLVEILVPALEKQVFLYYLPTVERRQLKDSGKFSAGNLIIALSQYSRFLAALVRFRPQIIHVHTSQGIAWLKDTFYVIVGKISHAHVVLHMHGGNFDTILDKCPRILQRYTQMILGQADLVIAVSDEWKKRLARYVSASRVFSLKNCLDVQSFRLKNSVISGKAVNILFVGRIGPLKGAFDLIEAAHSLQSEKLDFHLWLVGPEERNGDLQSAQRLLERYQLSDTCVLTGAVQREKILQLFQDADLFVLPSQYEGLPMTVLEALAASLPVIASAVGGIPEVVQDNCNGFLLQPGDIPTLTNRLANLARNPDLRKVMGERSRAIAEKDLDVRVYVDKMTALYSSLVPGEVN